MTDATIRSGAAPDALAFEAVTLAATFRRGRAFVAEFLTPSVVDLYDATVADPEWAESADLARQALVILRVLQSDAELAAGYQADVQAGLLGFGASEDENIARAIAEVVERLGEVAEAAPPPPPAPSMAPPGDGLLGEEGPVTEFPDEPSPAPDVVQSWLNADLEGPPLAVATASLLAVHFGEKTTRGHAAAIGIPIAAGDESVDVDVQLMSADFTVPRHPQRLTVGRDGRSDARALFEITPRHDGPSTLSVHVHVGGNFIQRLDLTYDVGTAAAPEATSFGRPITAAADLRERLATLQIKPVAGGFELTAKDVLAEPVTIPITPAQLAARIEDVRAALLAAVRKRSVALELTITPEDGDALLRELAFSGFRLFQAIFDGPQAAPALREVGRWLRETLSRDVTTLQVVSSGFPVPWPLLHLVDRFDAGSLSWDDFIGMRHVVEHLPLVQIDVAPPAVAIASEPALAVRTIYNDGIDEQMPSHPVAGQRAYWTSRGVRLTEGSTADHLVRDALAAGAPDQVLYLFCHATASDQDPDDARLILTGSESVSLGDLWVHAPREDQLAGRPLVFLNACESAELSPSFYDGFVPYFLTKGARGVIGTECKIPGLFAGEWAKAFFDELFAGRPLGEAVLELRRRFLTDHNNPFGLLYGVHADADTVVTPALPPRA